MDKRLISILIFSTQFFSFLYCQTYIPTLGVSNEWNIIKTFESTGTETYVANTDTVFAGTEYKIFEFMGFSENIAYLREDSLNKKIYVQPGDFLEDTSEYVLYDFSLNESDSILLYSLSYWEFDSLGYYYVDSIRDIEIESEISRIFYLHGEPYISPLWSENPVWVEGVGSLGSFLYPGASIEEYNLGELSCSYKDGIQVYQSPKYDSCMIFVNGVPSYERTDSRFKVYPTIVQEWVTVEDKTQEEHYEISIIDFSGRTLTKVTNLIGDYSLNLEGNSSGLYIIVIRSDKTIMTTQFIKE